MNIPLVVDDNSYDVTSRKNRKALLNTLIHLSPLHIMEIGSYIFQSTHTISDYIKKSKPNAHCVTVDVCKWSNSNPPPNTSQVMVYPWVRNIGDYHGDIKIYHPDYQDKIDSNVDLVELNTSIIYNHFPHQYDVCFLDGDHCLYSFMRDVEVCKDLLNQMDGSL